MMSLAKYFETIRGIDTRAEREAKRLREQLAHQEKKFKANHWEPARKAGKAIEKVIKARLKPHHVDFCRIEHWSIDHRDMSVHPCFGFEVTPRMPGAERYETQCRVPIKVSMTPRHEAEFNHVIAGIKAGADALASMMFTKAKESK